MANPAMNFVQPQPIPGTVVPPPQDPPATELGGGAGGAGAGGSGGQNPPPLTPPYQPAAGAGSAKEKYLGTLIALFEKKAESGEMDEKLMERIERLLGTPGGSA